MAEDGVVEVSVHIAAPPETVFPYFTDPGRYVQWMGRGATLEPVAGGRYRIQMRGAVRRSDPGRDPGPGPGLPAG